MTVSPTVLGARPSCRCSTRSRRQGLSAGESSPPTPHTRTRCPPKTPTYRTTTADEEMKRAPLLAAAGSSSPPLSRPSATVRHLTQDATAVAFARHAAWHCAAGNPTAPYTEASWAYFTSTADHAPHENWTLDVARVSEPRHCPRLPDTGTACTGLAPCSAVSQGAD